MTSSLFLIFAIRCGGILGWGAAGIIIEILEERKDGSR